MKPGTRRLPLAFAVLLMVTAGIFVTACSEDYATPVSSNGTGNFSQEFRYPELTPEALAAGPAPGFRFVELPMSALDFGGDTIATSKVCRLGRDENLNIGHMLELRIFANRLQQDNTLVEVYAPLGNSVCVADFYPHPYQFVGGTVRIKWKLNEMGFPSDTDFSTFVPFYVDDEGNYFEMPHEWEHGYDKLLVYTDHFSRYIIGQRVNG